MDHPVGGEAGVDFVVVWDVSTAEQVIEAGVERMIMRARHVRVGARHARAGRVEDSSGLLGRRSFDRRERRPDFETVKVERPERSEANDLTVEGAVLDIPRF